LLASLPQHFYLQREFSRSLSKNDVSRSVSAEASLLLTYIFSSGYYYFSLDECKPSDTVVEGELVKRPRDVMCETQFVRGIARIFN
jgi:hypothetical protein